MTQKAQTAMTQSEPKTQDRWIGQIIADRYKIEQCIGAGATGSVYRALQIGLGRRVALKLLNRLHSVDDTTVARFKREADTTSTLNHPNTVRVFDFGHTQEGVLYLVMELLEGELVTSKLQRLGYLSVTESIVYIQQVLRSVAEAHAKQIVHRDLKPDNLFLTQVEGDFRPHIKVLDFGIAKAIRGERTLDQFETQDGTVLGTPCYMSPEQAQGLPLDPRSDLYAIGIMLYEFLTGSPPFVDENAVAVMAKQINEQPMPVRKAAPMRPIPRSLENLLNKALQKETDKRFQTAEQFESELGRCLLQAMRMERRVEEGSSFNPLSKVRFWLEKKMVRAGVVGLACVILFWGLYWVNGFKKRGEKPMVKRGTPSSLVVPGKPISRSRNRMHASLNSDRNEAVSVKLDTQPSGADVWRNRVNLGRTPLHILVKGSESVLIHLSKPGYQDTTTDLTSRNRSRMIQLTELDPKGGESQPGTQKK